MIFTDPHLKIRYLKRGSNIGIVLYRYIANCRGWCLSYVLEKFSKLILGPRIGGILQ